MELTLKAFLRANDVPLLGTRYFGHDLQCIYQECRTRGLVVDGDDRFGVANIVSLLESGNIQDGFRYFTKESAALPDLNWAKEVVDRLMAAVEAAILAKDQNAFKPGKAIKGSMIFGAPQ